MKKLTLVLTALITTFAVFAQVQEEIRQVGSFNAVDARSGINVIVAHGNHQVKVKTTQEMMSSVTTEVRDNVLIVGFDTSVSGFKALFKDTPVDVYVAAPEFVKLTASGGADLVSGGIIKSNDLKLRASGGADLKLELDAKNVDADASGGADIELRGKAEYFKADCSGGADIKAYELVAKVCEAKASGGADIKVNVLNSLTAKASGGADIYYKGNPEKQQISASGGGSVKRK